MSRIVRVKSGSRFRPKARGRQKKRSLLSISFAKHFPKTYSKCCRLWKKAKKSPALILLAAFSVFSFLTWLICLISPDFAELSSNTLSHWVIIILSSICSVFSFSIAELLFVCLIAFFVVWLVFLIRSLKRKFTFHRVHRGARRVLWTPIILCVLVADLFFITFFPSYYRFGIDEKLAISNSEISEDDLYATLSYMVSELNADANLLTYNEQGASVMPLNFREISRNINETYNIIQLNHTFLPRGGFPAKSFLLSKPMTYFNISGVFTFFTGEANVNTNYPDYILPFTIAHECAHQRGIARENDASFLAFVACAQSTNEYIRYSGYLNTLLTLTEGLNDYLSSCEDRELATEIATNANDILTSLDDRVHGELAAYSDFFEPYRDSVAADIANDLNDTYLKAQGQADGISTYQKIVGLVVNYYANYMA